MLNVHSAVYKIPPSKADAVDAEDEIFQNIAESFGESFAKIS